MTAIERDTPYATLINAFTVEPDRAQELAAVLTEATESVMQHVEGFRSANIHVSIDGTRVVNYAQWDSAGAYQRMLADSAAREHMTTAADIADSFDPHLYTVESVHSI